MGSVMIKVNQTLLGKGGNCLAACIASILECDIERLPNYHDGSWFWDWEKFLEPHGIALLGNASYYWNSYWIGVVPSLNNDGRHHAVVMLDNKLAHDPNTPPSKVYTEASYKDCDDGYIIVLSNAGLFRRSSLYA